MKRRWLCFKALEQTSALRRHSNLIKTRGCKSQGNWAQRNHLFRSKQAIRGYQASTTPVSCECWNSNIPSNALSSAVWLDNTLCLRVHAFVTAYNLARLFCFFKRACLLISEWRKFSARSFEAWTGRNALMWNRRWYVLSYTRQDYPHASATNNRIRIRHWPSIAE